MTETARSLALRALRDIAQRHAYADIALDRVLRKSGLSGSDRGLTCELVYGCVRRQRTLDALLDQFGKRPASQQPLDLRLVLHLGLYQLRYLDHIPPSAAVDTSVTLAKEVGLGKLSGVVNGLLRHYLRQRESSDPLHLPDDAIARLGVAYSFPDWIVAHWVEQHDRDTAERLCQWFDRPPSLDLRVNPLRATRNGIAAAFQAEGIALERIPGLPQALRSRGSTGDVRNLPGFTAGWWSIQDSSAQLVTHLLDPQPGETIVDACAAPGGKTTHIAELMGNRGTILALDRDAKRLQRVTQNAERLRLSCIATEAIDLREVTDEGRFRCDRLLLDAPCSGLGTLHRRPDLRWRQTPANIAELAALQAELLRAAAHWVKPGGTLVYATCTVHPRENEEVLEAFCRDRPEWSVQPPPADNLAAAEGWVKVMPTERDGDGFFLARLVREP